MTSDYSRRGNVKSSDVESKEMRSASERKADDCQLQALVHATEGLTLADRGRHSLLRLLSAAQRRIDRLRTRLGQTELSAAAAPADTPGVVAVAPAADAAGPFREGDVVEVRAWEEIALTLDAENRLGGLEFMEEMKLYCGRRLQVKKRVRSIFDEHEQRFLRLKNAYILDGAICRSIHTYDREGCDRCCFFFWKEKWLKRAR